MASRSCRREKKADKPKSYRRFVKFNRRQPVKRGNTMARKAAKKAPAKKAKAPARKTATKKAAPPPRKIKVSVEPGKTVTASALMQVFADEAEMKKAEAKRIADLYIDVVKAHV